MKNSPVFVWQERVLRKINPGDIYCLETDRNYTRFHLRGPDRVMVRCTLDSALEMLPEDEFVKTHRSYAVSINFIEHISREYVRISGQDVPLSRRYYKPLLEKLAIIGSRTSSAKDE